RKPRLQRASGAERPRPPAALLAQSDDEGVVLVVQGRPSRQRRLETEAQLLVPFRSPDGAMPEQDAPGVGIDDERPSATRIYEDSVRRLRPDAAQPEQPLAQLGRAGPEHPVEPAAVPVMEEADESLDGERLLVEISGRPDQAGDPGPGCALQRVRAPQP